jgi:hypothetical protein
MERTSSPVLRTRTGKPLQKCYFSRLWEPVPWARTDHTAGAGDAAAPALPRQARNGGDDAVRSRLQPAADRGHPLKTVTVILDLYLARTRALASGDCGLGAFPADGICKPLSPPRRNEKANKVNKISGAPERIRSVTLQNVEKSGLFVLARSSNVARFRSGAVAKCTPRSPTASCQCTGSVSCCPHPFRPPRGAPVMWRS